ncbi:MAG: carboxypeptidase regulatory-like domain-containing protein [Acidobacteria bacterium]|nr:carboxypeptidase regulatory-like domain-containing protein [Acidobacteriota bacterium]MBW4044100.1 carboxypeptidase regulatory-like domain-containing protein [Acidobacteriota bacterium]
MHRQLFPSLKGLLHVVVVLLLAIGIGHGQDTNASLSGSVTDPTGASIPGAKLTLTNTATAFKTTLTTDAAGQYNFTSITPGRYDLSAAASGFKSITENGIQLTLSQHGRVNIKLPLGNAAETVTVSAESPEIDFDNPQLGGGIAPETLQDFPLIVSGAPRSSAAVALMMPGVSTGASGNAYNARINGGLVSGDEALVDGATAMEGYMNQSGMVSLQTDFGMSPDITSEVTVLTANYGAQYGNSTSGQIIIQTKSGGEQYHGSAYDYLTNRALNAYQYGTPAGTPKPENTQNDYGANLGGPIAIPGLHGPGSFLKGYFYFNWEGFQEAGGANSATLSIPSLNARAGNFGAAGSQLYYPNDVAKYGTDAGQPIAYNGVKNLINPAYEDPVAKAWMAELPTPTSGGELNNYFIPKAGQGSLTASENVYFGRVDFNIGNMDHLYYSTWWQFSGINTQSNLPIAISTAQPASPEYADIERLNWEHNFSGNMNNHATLGYLDRNEGYYALNGKAALPVVSGVANTKYLPEFTFGGGYTQLGNNAGPDSAANLTTRGTWAFNDVFTRVMGAHTFTAGFEWRLAGTSIHHGVNQGGTFNFAPDTTGNQGCPSAAACPGDAAASFYLGAAASANVQYYNVFAEYPRQPAYALHVGDSWRVNPKLTLDYSLRWDYIAPFREKYNNLSFIDPTGLNPGAVTTGGKELRGRLAFAGHGFGAASYGAPYPEIPFKKAFAPRVGFAYAATSKTVVRAGYGIYFGQAFYPGWGGGMGQDGFNKNLTLNQSPSGNFQVPALYLAGGITPAQVGVTKNISASFDNGQTPSLYRPQDGNRRPYSSQWNLTIQQQLPHNFAATLSYVGTKGTHLPSTLNPINILNPYDPSIAKLGSDLAVSYNSANGPATFAADGISQPYVGWAGQMTGCAPTVAQALLPFPQYCGDLQGLNEQHATSIYNSFQGELERRFKNGLYVLGTLTVSDLYTDSSYATQSTAATGVGNDGAFSPFNEKSRAYALAPDNVPVTVQISAVYDLPFGHHKQFLTSGGPMNMLVGGWQVSPLFRYEYGTPLWFSSSSCPTGSLVPEFRESCVPGILPGQKPLLHGRNSFNPAQDGGRYLNPAAFESNFSTFGYTGFGKAVSTIYGPSYKDTDIALTKNTQITDKVTFRFTANFFNAFNNHSFVTQGNGPGLAFVTDVAASGNSFGTWNGTVSNPRNIQVAARILF